MFKNCLSVATLAFLATTMLPQTGFSQRVDSIALFQQLDKNGDGTVTSDEVSETKKSLYKRLLRIGDKDKDTRLTQKELTDALATRKAGSEKPDEKAARSKSQGNRQAGFGGRNRSGANGRASGGMSADAILSRFDTNKDGKLSQGEIPEQAERLQQMVKGADKNKDGTVTKQELTLYLASRGGGNGGQRPSAGQRSQGLRSGGRQQQGMRGDGQGRGGFGQGGSGRKGRSGGGMSSEMILNRFDTNKDGKLSKGEIPAQAARLQQMIQGADKNKDGTITKDELTQHFSNGSSQRGRKKGAGRSGDVLTQRHGPDKSPAVGGKAPDFELKLLNSDEKVKFSAIYSDKPVALTLGSYTCPPYRNALEGINDLSQKYSNDFAFYFVYIKEAHATDERPSRGNEFKGIDFEQPKTYQEREVIAKTCQSSIELTMPILVDTLDNAVERLYAGAPNRTYLIDQNGTVLYKGVRGPQGSRPGDIQMAMEKHLANRETKVPGIDIE